MSTKQVNSGFATVLIIVFGVFAFALARVRHGSVKVGTQDSSKTSYAKGDSQPRHEAVPKVPTSVTVRNLSLQPEGFNMSQRLGRRFSSATREQSTLIGVLTIGAGRRVATILRKQIDDGEQVEIHVAGFGGVYTWDRTQGALTSNARAVGSDRDLIERLVFDSPDQFVLSQLRGSSYHTILRNLRPAGAVDGYSGPLWNVVRVDDPETDADKKPVSPWRLYYVNVSTGLIDRVVSDFHGQQLTAEISNWSDVNSEKVPSQISWTSQGQTLMQYSLTNFTHALN